MGENRNSDSQSLLRADIKRIGPLPPLWWSGERAEETSIKLFDGLVRWSQNDRALRAFSGDVHRRESANFGKGHSVILTTKGHAMKRKASPPVTEEMASKIKYLYFSKGLFQHQIAALLEINQGRVSEVLNGKRWPGADPSDQPSLGF